MSWHQKKWLNSFLLSATRSPAKNSIKPNIDRCAAGTWWRSAMSPWWGDVKLRFLRYSNAQLNIQTSSLFILLVHWIPLFLISRKSKGLKPPSHFRRFVPMVCVHFDVHPTTTTKSHSLVEETSFRHFNLSICTPWLISNTLERKITIRIVFFTNKFF